ncbi:MAG: DUF420 domain-containing protein [Akkermansiaceae bacterium]
MSEISEYRQLPVQTELAGRLRVGVWVVTGLVFLLVGAMRSPYKIPLPDGVSVAMLPQVHAGLNTLVAACLLAALLAIGRGAVKWHRRFMVGALILSVLFLLSYVAYHFTTVETKFGDANADGFVDDKEAAEIGILRTVYLAILITHIIAAAVSFPMILFTFVHAWTNDFEKHRKLAKKTFPLWLYVSITGPLCYFMLKAYYVN